MKPNELRRPSGAHRKPKRVGRGDGSGRGTYSGRGCKGQKVRSGGGVRLGFEGGQLPLVKRLPHKRGFTNIFKTQYNVVNVGSLASFPEGSEVTPQRLKDAGMIGSTKLPTKVLGQGEIRQAVTVRASRFSAAAEKKIVAAGGKAERI